MRNILLLITFSALVITSCGPKNEYRITGTLTGKDSVQLFLMKRDAGTWVSLDSAMVSDGSFAFSGLIDSPEMYYLSDASREIFIPVFVEQSPMTIDITIDSLMKSEIKGSKTHDVYVEFTNLTEPLNKEMNEIYAQYKKASEAGDEAGMSAADSMYEAAEAKKKELILEFAKNHPGTVVAPYLILRNIYQFELPEIEEVVVVLDTNLGNCIYYSDLLKRRDILRSVQIGMPAPDFTQNDTAGNPLTLSSLRGKWLLVDFWASWCGPCRAENPNVVDAWKKYHDKGFDVLGVSLDKSRDKWIEAIHSDDLTWNQVSDLQYWNNAASTLYGISSIPSNVLLDPEGNIVAWNLRGEDLPAKLEEVLKP